ncbi:PQ-loop-domain-containing protein [Meredithblackwellia eburnea MCA 4105]
MTNNSMTFQRSRPLLPLVLVTLALASSATAFSPPPLTIFAANSRPPKTPPVQLPPGEQDPDILYDGYPRLASMVGWISISAWIVVYTPQLWLCFAQQSGEGLSLIFLCIWLAGDLTNLLGAFWQGLLSTMIILAVYYTLCDIILIFQVFYYRRKRTLYPHLVPPVSETEPLLSSFSSGPHDTPETKASRRARTIVSYVGGAGIVFAIGAVAWYLSKDAPQGRRREVWDTKAQVVGWFSAFMYLGSRLPQIAKNRETKCQGLSLLMFAFAVAGNTTYVASILLQSLTPQHLLINASWLVGSGGTIFLDFVVLGQFYWYASARSAMEQEGAKLFVDENGNGRRGALEDEEEA